MENRTVCTLGDQRALTKLAVDMTGFALPVRRILKIKRGTAVHLTGCCLDGRRLQVATRRAYRTLVFRRTCTYVAVRVAGVTYPSYRVFPVVPWASRIARVSDKRLQRVVNLAVCALVGIRPMARLAVRVAGLARPV
jgi:hypothetical protein